MNRPTSASVGSADSVAAPSSRAAARRRARLPLMGFGFIVVLGGALYFYLHSGRIESTDDAYVQAARTSISADVAGRVVELAVHDNQAVHKGDLLYRLDDAPFKIAVEQAQAELESQRLNVTQLKANYKQRLTELVAAQDTYNFSKTELDRQKRLIGEGISSQAQVDKSSNALDEANQRIAGAQQGISAALAQLGGNANIPAEQHPAVKQAQAALDKAMLNLSYAAVHAPSDGVVTRVEQLQVGSYVNAAAPVFALVSTHDIWLEANFKEDQLTHMKVGQEASVLVDSYPGKTFKGKVVSVSPGTGTEFSVLPPENATGNWVKVVQRLPVRVEISDEDPAYPLHAGLSATVDVDTLFKRHLFGHNEIIAGPQVAER